MGGAHPLKKECFLNLLLKVIFKVAMTPFVMVFFFYLGTRKRGWRMRRDEKMCFWSVLTEAGPSLCCRFPDVVLSARAFWRVVLSVIWG